jgi:BASS family bile acid:Na+ symporter
VGFFACLAIGVRAHPVLGDFTFTLSVFASVTLAMFYPGLLDSVAGVELTIFIVPLIQIIMFGMGASLSVDDFARVIQMPRGVLVGVVCQFSIMPLVGFTLATTLGLPDEIAAGIVLIGSAPSGVASNVMAYISESNLALSVTLTAVATLLAPVMTPFLMEVLAGQFVPVEFWAMMWSIIKMIIAPVALGLLFNRYAHGKAQWLDDIMPIISMVAITVIIAIITAAGQESLLTVGLTLVAAAVVHNATGYLLGYWICRLIGMSEKDSRTISFEVGMQNGGLASGLAVEMGKVATVGLAPAIFGPWMNITGSALANYWRREALEEEPAEAPSEAPSPASAE